MPRKNIEKVIAAWRQGKEAQGDSKRTCWTDGKSIYSYHTCIATLYNGFVVLNVTKYSATTSQQQRAVESAVSHINAHIIKMDGLDRGIGAKQLTSKLSAEGEK